MPENEGDIGALWIKDGKSGKFMSGKIKVGDSEVSVVVFRNTHKQEGSKQPDYRVFRQRERTEERQDSKPVNDRDIPF